jgi:hypothetical protein
MYGINDSDIHNDLVGGLEQEFYFSIYWECHHPNWRAFFQRGWNHQPVIIKCILMLIYDIDIDIDSDIDIIYWINV